MTEEEAGTKWCPHAIASHTNPRQHNGEVWLHNCIGSACMAWRHAPVFIAQVNDKGETVQIEGRSYTDFYCGLAGKP